MILVVRYTYTRYKCSLKLLTDEDKLISRSDSQSFGYNNYFIFKFIKSKIGVN